MTNYIIKRTAIEFADYIEQNGWIKDPFPRKDFDDEIIRYTNCIVADDDNGIPFEALTPEELYDRFLKSK